MSEEIDKQVFRKYDILQRLGKGVSQLVAVLKDPIQASIQSRLALCRHMALYGKQLRKKVARQQLSKRSLMLFRMRPMLK